MTEETTAEVTEETPEETPAETEETPADEEETPAQDTETTPEDASGEESAPKEDADVSGTGTEGDGTAAVTDGTENAGTETKTDVSADVSAETEPVVEAEISESQEKTAGALETKIVFGEDDALDKKLQELSEDFECDPEAAEYTYTIPYGVKKYDANVFDSVMGTVKGVAKVEVDGTPVDALDEFLTAEWQEVKGGTPAAMNGKVPEDAGSYVLHFVIEAQSGLCQKKECDIHFEITKKELELGVDSIVNDEQKPLKPKAGDKIADFVEVVKEAVKDAVEKDKRFPELTDKVMHPVTEVAVSVFQDGTAISEGYFSNKSDYSYTVAVTLEESLGKNYKFDCDEYGEYRLELAGVLQPEVELEITDPGKTFDQEYVKDKKWTIDEIVGTRVKAKVTVKTKAKDETGNTDDQGESVELEGATAAPAWYIKETIKLSSDESQWPSIDEETQFADIDRDKWSEGTEVNLYTAMGKEESVSDVGDYYIVYVYGGVTGQFAKAMSKPIKVTINPITVILKPESCGTLSFGMDSDDIGRVLAGVTGKLYLPKDAANPIEAGEDGKVEIGDDFYGVTYDDKSKIQYYAPVFRLARTETPITDGKPAAAESTDLKPVDELDPSTNEMQYKYYIVFSGKKAARNADGRLDLESQEPVFRDITETSTDSANRNYKILMDEDVLLNRANVIEAPMAERVETEINVEPIVTAFNAQHNYKVASTGSGNIESPARMVYDPEKSLFEKREDYKKATLNKKGGASVEYEADDMHYELQKFVGSEEDYHKLINTKMPEDDKSDAYADWQNLKNELEKSAWKSVSNDKILKTKDAGFYRLEVTYKDSSLEAKNEQAKKYAYFLIEKQEVVLVPDTQYAEYGEDKTVGAQSQKWYGFTVKKVKDNVYSEDTLETTTWDGEGTWGAMTLPVNESGESPKDPKPEDWIEMNPGEFFIEDLKEDGTNRYIYKTFVELNSTGSIIDKDTNEAIKDSDDKEVTWANYTTEDQSKWDADNEKYRQHAQSYGDILFGKTEIKLTVEGIDLSGEKEYDNTAIYANAPTVKIVPDGTGLTVSEAEPQDPKSVVRIGWRWKANENDPDSKTIKVVPTAEAKFGGTYTLVASYKGNDTYKAITGDTDEWQNITDKNGKPYTFTVTKRKVVVKPKLKDKVTAGDLLETLLDDEQDIEKPANVAPGDEPLFVKGSGSITSVMDGKTSYYKDGYPILTVEGNKENDLQSAVFESRYYKNGKPIDYRGKDSSDKDKLIRSEEKYGVALEAPQNGLFKEYALSYEISTSDKAAFTGEIIRGDSGVGYVNFYKESGDDNYNKGVDVYTEITDKTATTPKTYEIRPREGIPFIYGDDSGYGLLNDNEVVDGKEIPLNQNYIAVNIYSPSEFNSDLYSYNEWTDVADTYGRDKFLYRTSIKNAGGYVIDEYYEENGDDKDKGYYKQYVITVLFPVKMGDDGKPVSPEQFKITWEKDYEETFKLNLENAKLEADLTEAVAPKSLAFNGVVTKMAVGEEQQLDVKIKKAQLGDVIRINYRLATEEDEKYASIDKETGRITALSVKVDGDSRKPVVVNVEAYPVHFDAKTREFVEIESKLKPAKTKITISDVTAPAIKKVIPKDTTVEVQYTKVNDGYRREIYVAELGKVGTPEAKAEAREWKDSKAFEKVIKEQMVNGQWKGIFAVEPKYLSGNAGYDSKLKLCKATIGGRGYEFELNPNVMYAVYVRNVSAVRTLANGKKVSESASGSVKTFNTTGTKVEGLELYFDQEVTTNKVTPVDEKDPSVVNITDKEEKKYYTVNLEDKTAQLSVRGFFSAKLFDSNADDGDEGKSFKLPLKSNQEYKDLQQKDLLVDPKLSYYIIDGKDSYLQFDAKGKLKNPSKYATISNNGKISLKGVGENGEEYVTIFACPDIVFTEGEDEVEWATTNNVVGVCYLRICAEPDGITYKKVKPIKVGDGIRLADYLEYTKSGKKIPNYWSSDIVITNEADLEDKGFEVHKVSSEDKGDDGYYRYKSVDGVLREGEYVITATKPEIAAMPVKFTDGSASGLAGQTFELLSISSAKMDLVKGLKAVYTDDKHITINFAYAGHPEAFDIEVSDARSNLVYKKLVFREDAMANFIGTEDLVKEPWLQNKQNSILDGFMYFEKTKMFAYTIDSEKLMRLSTYTVTVDPIYDGESASAMNNGKLASTKAKTTNIPASYEDAGSEDPRENYIYSGSSYLFLHDRIDGDSGNEEPFGTYLISGNTYTVYFNTPNYQAQTRGTDTLSWKSSNTKVLSVKANQGSYSATLKPMQQGRATITVTSKVTKKTIARWHVAVKAVGDGKNYGGDFEYIAGTHTHFYDAFIITHDPYYEGKVEVLTVTNPVTVEGDELLNYPGLDNEDEEWNIDNNRTWVQFTAPGYGEYTFLSTNSFDYYFGGKANKGGKVIDCEYDLNTQKYGYWLKKMQLEEGQKIYFQVAGTFKLSVDQYTDFSKLTVGKSLKATKDTWVSFTAEKDNFYTFVGEFNSSENYFKQNNDFIDYKMEDVDVGKGIGLEAGETVFVYVKKDNTLSVTERDLSIALALNAAKATEIDVSRNEDGNDAYAYATFKPGKAGEYCFEYTYPSATGHISFHPILGVSDDGEVTGEAVDGAKDTWRYTKFIEEDETVVVQFRVENRAFLPDKTSVPVTIKVTGEAAETLTNEAKLVANNTSKIFEFPIPEKAAKYTLKVEKKLKKVDEDVATPDDALRTIIWTDAKGNHLEVTNDSFIVEDGKVRGITPNESLKPGDKIYVKVDVNVESLSEEETKKLDGFNVSLAETDV